MSKATATAPSTGDIVQDRFGWFFRINADGTAADLSNPKPRTVKVAAIDAPTVVHSATGGPVGGDSMAQRVARVMARRYATA